MGLENETNDINFIKPQSKASYFIAIFFIVLTCILSVIISILRSVKANGSPAYSFGYNTASFLIPFFIGFIITMICMLFVKKRKKRILIFAIASLFVSILFFFSSLLVYSEYKLKEVSIQEMSFSVPIIWEHPDVTNDNLVTMGDKYATTGITIKKFEPTIFKNKEDFYKNFKKLKDYITGREEKTNTSDLIQLTVDDKPAASFETTEKNNGRDSVFIYTGILRGNSLYLVSLWVDKSEYEFKKSLLDKIINSINFK